MLEGSRLRAGAAFPGGARRSGDGARASAAGAAAGTSPLHPAVAREMGGDSAALAARREMDDVDL